MVKMASLFLYRFVILMFKSVLHIERYNMTCQILEKRIFSEGWVPEARLTSSQKVSVLKWWHLSAQYIFIRMKHSPIPA